MRVRTPEEIKELKDVYGVYPAKTPKEEVLINLQNAVFQYLVKEKGFWGEEQTISILLNQHSTEKKGIFGWSQDEGVNRANKFRLYVKSYPKDKTIDELIDDISLLYVNNNEFPVGLGSSKELRKYICESLGNHLGELITYEESTRLFPPTVHEKVHQQLSVRGNSLKTLQGTDAVELQKPKPFK